MTPKLGGPFGGYQADCRYHKLSTKTGCKRFFPFESDDVSHKAEVLRALLWWCLQYSEFKRQRDHIAFIPDPDDVPCLDFILNCEDMVKDGPVPGGVKTDYELDIADGIAPVGPYGGKAKAKAKTKQSPKEQWPRPRPKLRLRQAIPIY